MSSKQVDPSHPFLKQVFGNQIRMVLLFKFVQISLFLSLVARWNLI